MGGEFLVPGVPRLSSTFGDGAGTTHEYPFCTYRHTLGRYVPCLAASVLSQWQELLGLGKNRRQPQVLNHDPQVPQVPQVPQLSTSPRRLASAAPAQCTSTNMATRQTRTNFIDRRRTIWSPAVQPGSASWTAGQTPTCMQCVSNPLKPSSTVPHIRQKHSASRRVADHSRVRKSRAVP